MADTAKKSRIVSETITTPSNDEDDNLEEALMEEFNNRLKSCMSQDDLLKDYSQELIDNERHHHYDIPPPPKPLTNGNASTTTTTTNVVVVTDDVTMTSQTIDNQRSVKDRMLLSTDDVPCLLFTQTITSPMLTPSDETNDFLKDFETKTTTTTITTNTYENLIIDNNLYENIIDNNHITIDENVYETIDVKHTIDGVSCDVNQTIDDEKQPIDGVSCDVDQTSNDRNHDEITIDGVENNELINESNINDDITPIDGASCDVLKYTNGDNDSHQSETYVETTTTTTTFGDIVPEQTEKIIKKKKTRKSRKEEKENISVKSTNITTNQNYYKVDVKHLCKYYGNQVSISQVAPSINIKNNLNGYKYSKSLTDLTDNQHVKLKSCMLTIKRPSSLIIERSSLNKFDALTKKNILHVRSTDSSKAQEKFNGAQIEQSTQCRACDKQVFQMEQIKAEKSVWHKNCFRCNECNKQLNVDTYESHESKLYCKPHFKALFTPKAVEDDTPPKSRKAELIIRENQPLELPPDVVRASDKPDLGLEELQLLNVKERFQVFENHQQNKQLNDDNDDLINRHQQLSVKRSPSILSKLAKFQSKGMDVGVSDDILNGIPIEESSSDNEQDNNDIDDDNNLDGIDGDMDDVDLIRAKRVEKEKPFHFTGMSDVKNKWEQQTELNATKDERREERKQEIQTIRNRLFLGKQVKMKEAYQQAIIESETGNAIKSKEPLMIELAADTKSIKERFERGEITSPTTPTRQSDADDEVYQSELSKRSRTLFREMEAQAPNQSPCQPGVQPPKLDVRKARDAYLSKTATNGGIDGATDDIIRGQDNIDVVVPSADIQERFKFFETYKQPETEKKQFRMTPPRDGQVKEPTPEESVGVDGDKMEEDEQIVAVRAHTATKMLSKFRQMEEQLAREQVVPQGLKPLKQFTPPPEPYREDRSSSEYDDDDEDEDDEEEDEDEPDKIIDGDLVEAQKAARAKQLRAKFERWEANEIKREQQNVNVVEEFSDEQGQIESTRTLRARFESLRDGNNQSEQINRSTKIKVNRFVDYQNTTEKCEGCHTRVYPLEKVSVHGRLYHRTCFKCMECHSILRMDSYSSIQGLLYCIPHFKRLFITKGNYDSAFGLTTGQKDK